MINFEKNLPTMILSFSDASHVPAKLPNIPVLAGGAVPMTGDSMRFFGSNDLFMVMGREFSYDEQGKTTLTLILEKR